MQAAARQEKFDKSAGGKAARTVAASNARTDYGSTAQGRKDAEVVQGWQN